MLSEASKTTLERAIQAIHERTFFAQWPEHHKAYGEGQIEAGQAAFEKQLGNAFSALGTDAHNPCWVGEEQSPYTGQALGITYAAVANEVLMNRAQLGRKQLAALSVDDRAELLLAALEGMASRFFEIAFATMHTTGQSFMMAFQASGPHAADRALEALALAWQELKRFPEAVRWEKPMGKFSVKLDKTYRPVPKGVALAIGCSTFPTWNSVPGIFANLVSGNPVIVKPHPGSVLPIAIVVEELQKALATAGAADAVQLAPDTSVKLIAKELATHDAVRVIDYTGSSEFGTWLEGLAGKTVFAEKAGVNPVILDSCDDLDAVLQNLAFSVSLYSGQMCTTPQNFFIPADGVKAGTETVPYHEVVDRFKAAVVALAENPKMGPGTLAAIQNPATLQRAQEVASLGARVLLESAAVAEEAFPAARKCSPAIIEVAADSEVLRNELFGPVVVLVKTANTAESIAIVRDLALEKGVITCGCYTTDAGTRQQVIDQLEPAFVPVSFNLSGFIWVNQHATFSDFHVTGGNPAGNASFANPEFVTRRFVWVGHRELATD